MKYLIQMIKITIQYYSKLVRIYIYAGLALTGIRIRDTGAYLAGKMVIKMNALK